jgi:hypothetical protein
MKVLSLVDPLPENDTVMIKIDNKSVKLLNEIINVYKQKKLGDQDDHDKQQLVQDLKDDFLELKDLLNPS